ncbi:hypothetical protein [Nocardioides koreensis]
MTDVPVHARQPGSAPTYGRELLELLRIVVVAGVAVGILVIGLGGRLAMLLLRLTSPGDVVGVTSDDGFEIGRTTLAGTYNLMLVGASVGLIGAVAYVAVAPWLIGRRWFRYLTVGVTAAALGGALLLHDDGVDFTRTGPLWFAVALFLALPFGSGVALAAVTDAVSRPGSWTSRGHARWVLPVVLVGLVLPVLPLLLPLTVVLAVLLALHRLLLAPIRASTVATLAVRSAFFAIPALSFVALGQDLAELF